MRQVSHIVPRSAILLAVAILSVVLSGCSGAASAANSWPGISLGNQAIYVSFNQAVHAIDPASGAERWHFPAEADRKLSFFAAPTPTDDGRVIVGGYDNKVYSLNASDGSVAWKFEGSSNRIVGNASVGGIWSSSPAPTERSTRFAFRMGR